MKYIVIIFILGIIISCNNDPLLDIDNAQKTIVVDAWIEEGSGPNVLLTWNSPYFTKLDSESIAKLVIRSAKVTVSDSVTTEILTLRNNKNSFPPYVYQGFDIVGQSGRKYTLKVEYKDFVLEATTSIPRSVAIDSAWFELNEKDDSTGTVFLNFIDDPNEKNYYRTYSRIFKKQKKYFPTLYSNFDDKYFDKTQISLELNQGPEAYIEYDIDINYSLGDSIIMKLTTIDANTYNYWNIYQQEVINIGNPFASSFSTIPSNISKPGLGIWAGYGVSYYSIKAK